MKTGIILVALGYELYGSCALNLAMSLKAYGHEVPVLLIHDEASIKHLTPEEKEIFDFLKLADPSDYTIDGKKEYQRMKICVDKYTEFENTLYIDVDTIWFPKKNIGNLLMHLVEREFFIGKSGEYNPENKKNRSLNYTYWEKPEKICAYFGLKNTLPQTVSGVFFFKKGEFSNKIFDRCREIYDDKNAPCMSWAGGKPDEYCFNVALCEAGYSQHDSHIVFFDKINGNLSRRQIYDNFWGLAIGGGKLSNPIANLYNELVDLFCSVFEFKPRYNVNKSSVIAARK